jgi:hypothetical protein
MTEAFLKSIEIIKSAIADRKLVVFAGAGTSIDAGIPSWGQLIEELRQEIDIPSHEGDFLRIAQMYHNERQEKEFIDKIRSIIKHKTRRYNAIQEEIFNLGPEHILTTNFDDLLEQVIQSKAYPYSVIKGDQEFPYAKNTKLLVKIHGDLDDANIVIKEDDYLDYGATHPLIESFIKGVFATKVVLFVGYSFSDVDLKIILQNVRNILGSDFQNAYLLSLDDEFHPSQRQYLRNKGINVIHYQDGGEHSVLRQLHHQAVKSYPAFSEKGQKLIAILKYINKYDGFTEQLQRDDALIQMHKSLQRFGEVRTLPPRFLGNLYPFNIRKAYIHNYHEYVLGSNNKGIVEFFFNDFDPENLTVKNSYFEKHHITAARSAYYNSCLTSVLHQLNYSLVLRFGGNPDKIELFDYPKQFAETVNVTVPEKCCSCLSCLYNELNFKEFLQVLREATITQTSDLKTDLLIAYSHYKAGNFSIAVSQFEEIANKAWQVEHYITYYIAQQNVKHLRNLLNWDVEELDRDNNRKIIDKIDDIDLDKLLFQIPSLSDDVYKLLKLIRDDDVLHDAERKITEAYEQIRDGYQKHKKNHSSYSDHEVKIISRELNSIFFFYTYNYIVKDEYSNFRDLMEKGVKGLLIWYAIVGRQRKEATPFNPFIVKFIVLYMSERTLEATLTQYEVEEIFVSPEEASKFARLPNHLFESFFSEVLVFGREVRLNKQVAVQSENYFFGNRLRSILHNTFSVYSVITLPDEYYPVIVTNFLDFFRVEQVLAFPSEKAFNRFIQKILPYFSFEQISELIQIATSKEFLLRSGDFFEHISLACEKAHPDKKLEKIEILEDLIAASIDQRKSKDEISFLHLYKICSQPLRELIRQKVEEKLSAHFDLYDYMKASFDDIIDPAKFYPNIIKQMESSMPKLLKFEHGKPVQRDLTFSNFVNLIYAKGLLNDDFPFTRFEDYPDYWKFYLKPFEFDYSTFDPRWLLIIYSRYPFMILKDIPQIKQALESTLSGNYDESLSEIYTRFFISQPVTTAKTSE